MESVAGSVVVITAIHFAFVFHLSRAFAIWAKAVAPAGPLKCRARNGSPVGTLPVLSWIRAFP
ncbi:hypothetical protein GCM10019059_04530 [Camelimonas fluminis]|nr:hypothetical protein GCM10019059_04530 [Camelimonas fluminis]